MEPKIGSLGGSEHGHGLLGGSRGFCLWPVRRYDCMLTVIQREAGWRGVVTKDVRPWEISSESGSLSTVRVT